MAFGPRRDFSLFARPVPASFVEQRNQRAKVGVEARAAGQVVDRTAPVSGVLSGGVLVGSAVAGAAVGKRNVDSTLAVDVEVVEIEEVPVGPPNVTAIALVEADGTH